MLLTKLDNIEYLCGTDEAGAGCLAGPVVAASLILPTDYFHPKLNDSKKMSLKDRELVFTDIINNAIEYSIKEVDNIEIDNINILQARLKAMDLCVKEMNLIEHLLVDGNIFYKKYDISYTTVIKGDSKWACIAGASVLAKVYRDKLMNNYHTQYPYYSWDSNKGYGTKKHYEGIELHGICELHRKSFLKSIINN